MEDKYHLGIKALIKNKEGKYLLLKVNKKALKGYTGEAYWDIPGGRVQKGDTVENTLKREIEEETGIKNISEPKPITMVLSNIRIPLDTYDVGLILSIYECEINENEQIKLSEEHTTFAWLEPQEAAKLLKIKYPDEFTHKIFTKL